MIHALRGPPLRYKSNDRVLVSMGAEPPAATGVPTLVSLRRATLELFPDVAERQARAGYHACLALGETAAEDEARALVAGALLGVAAGRSAAQSR